MTSFLSILQIVIASLLVVSILLQQRGTAMGSAFGGGGATYTSRRGIQQSLYWATIVLALVFGGLAVSNFFLL